MMKRTQKLVILSRLARELEARGSWGGETHLQKATYLLEEMTGVPLGYPFISYMHGPFSFELRDELNRMRAEGHLRLVSQPYPYGPSFRPTPEAERLEIRFPRTLGAVSKQIQFVADIIGNRSAAELERLGTALFLLVEIPGMSVSPLSKRFHRLKPHVSVEAARASLSEMKKLLEGAPRITGKAARGLNKSKSMPLS